MNAGNELQEISCAYLGNGVYVRSFGSFLQIMANSDLDPTDTVSLEQDTLIQLIHFAKQCNMKVETTK